MYKTFRMPKVAFLYWFILLIFYQKYINWQHLYFYISFIQAKNESTQKLSNK